MNCQKMKYLTLISDTYFKLASILLKKLNKPYPYRDLFVYLQQIRVFCIPTPKGK